MSVLFMEGFGQCSIGDHPPSALSGIRTNWNTWDDVSTDISISAYDSGPMGLRNYLTFGYIPVELTSYIFPKATTIVFGARVYRYNTSNCVIAQLGGVGFVGVNASGALRYTRNTTGNLNHSTEAWGSTATLAVGYWTYVEVKVVMDNTVGSVAFYLDGSFDSEVTGIDTIMYSGVQDGCDFIRTNSNPGNMLGAQNWRITDIYVTDGDVLGTSEVWYQPADTAGSGSNMTPSAGNNEDNVDEVTDPDGDSTYNASTTPGTKDQIAHSTTHQFGPYAVQPLAWARGVGDGMTKAKIGILSGATESLGATELLGSDYQVVRGTIHDTDPNTGSAWTAAGVDAAETVIQHAA